MASWWEAKPSHGFTAACFAQLMRMKTSKFSRVLLGDIRRDMVGLPPPHKLAPTVADAKSPFSPEESDV